MKDEYCGPSREIFTYALMEALFLTDRGSVACAEVEVLADRSIAELGEVSERGHMTVSKVDDVNVVSLTTAVLRGIVGAKDGEVGPNLCGHLCYVPSVEWWTWLGKC